MMSKDSLRYIIESLVRDVNYLKCNSKHNQGGGTTGVANINGIQGGVSILAGDNVEVETLGNNITISSAGNSGEVKTPTLDEVLREGNSSTQPISLDDEYSRTTLSAGNINISQPEVGFSSYTPRGIMMSFAGLGSIQIDGKGFQKESPSGFVTEVTNDFLGLSNGRESKGLVPIETSSSFNLTFNTEVLGIDAVSPKGLVTLSQVESLIESSGGNSKIPTLNEVLSSGKSTTESILIYKDSKSALFSESGLTFQDGDSKKAGISSNGEDISMSINGSLQLWMTKFGINFYKPLSIQKATAESHAVNLGQMNEKDFIVSPDGSKWGVTDEGTLYKLP